MKKISKLLSAAAVMLLALIMSAVTAFAAEDDILVFEGEGKSNGSWGQAYNLNIRSDEKNAQLILMLNENSKIYVDFELEGTPTINTQGIELILQKWEKKGGDQIWAQTPPSDITDGVASFDYAAMVDAYGSDDFSTVDQIFMGDTGAVLTVKKIVFDINGDGVNGDTVDIPDVGGSANETEDSSEETTTAAADDEKEEETTSKKADDKDKTDDSSEEAEEESSSVGTIVIIVVIAVVVIAAVVVVLVLKNRKKYY